MIFGLMLDKLLLITHVKNKEIEEAKNEKNGFKSQQVQFQKSHKMLALHLAVFGHLNSYSFKFNSWIVLWTMSTDPAIEMSEVSEVVHGGKQAFCVIFDIGLVVIWSHFSHFWLVRFLCFLTCIMRRTIANIKPKIF